MSDCKFVPQGVNAYVFYLLLYSTGFKTMLLSPRTNCT